MDHARKRSADHSRWGRTFNCRPLRLEALEERRVLAVVTVDTLVDSVDLADGVTSLREAIFAANTVTGEDTIRFDPTLTAGGPATILLTQGELAITDSLTIDGPGAELLTIDASGNDPTPGEVLGDGSRVLNVDDGNSAIAIDVTIRGLTLTGGDAREEGGAIRSRENVSLLSSRVTGNAAVAADVGTLSRGGAIDHQVGVLAVANTMITDNSADFGGGIYFGSGVLSVDRSVVADNEAQSGAGLIIDSGDAQIANSVIRDNRAPGGFSLGGGIYTSGNVSITATTISGNSAAYGAGIFSRTAFGSEESTHIAASTLSGNTASVRGGGVRNALGRTVIEHSTISENVAPDGQGGGVATRGYDTAHTVVRSTIIAGNTGSDVDFVTGATNTFESAGYNLIGGGGALSAFVGPFDQTGIAEPLLGPLADNGGFGLPDGTRIQTHALLVGSLAINAGDLDAIAGVDGVPEFDERGKSFGRVFDGRIDIGAVESQPLPGDFNFSGTVDNEDLILLLNNWSTIVPPTPAGWIGAPPTGPAVDNNELTLVLNHWGTTFGGRGSLAKPVAPSMAVHEATLAEPVAPRNGLVVSSATRSVPQTQPAMPRGSWNEARRDRLFDGWLTMRDVAPHESEMESTTVERDNKCGEVEVEVKAVDRAMAQFEESMSPRLGLRDVFGSTFVG